MASNFNPPEELPAISEPNLEAVREFIRMIETPGPNDHHVLSFICNHLFDPELRSQRGSRIR